MPVAGHDCPNKNAPTGLGICFSCLRSENHVFGGCNDVNEGWQYLALGVAWWLFHNHKKWVCDIAQRLWDYEQRQRTVPGRSSPMFTDSGGTAFKDWVFQQSHISGRQLQVNFLVAAWAQSQFTNRRRQGTLMML